MAAPPREFRVAIVGKVLPRKVILDLPFELTDFVATMKSECLFAPGEMDRLELRHVGEEPAPRNAVRLFEASTRQIESTADLNADDVRYIVGKIAEPIGEWIAVATQHA
jgi:hypothetical protein